MPECDQYSVRYPHPKCVDIATLETMVKLHKEAWEKEFVIFRSVVEGKFHDVNQLRHDVISDRNLYFLKSSHDYFAESITKEIKEIKRVVDRNSERLTNIENLYARTSDVDKIYDSLKEFHEKDLIIVNKTLEEFGKLNLPQIKKDTDGFTRLVWIGVGIVIAAQCVLHYYFLKG